jgi:hypothetical protein
MHGLVLAALLVVVSEGLLPNPQLTPGAVVTSDVRTICARGYATRVRPKGALWRHLKDEAYNRYHLARGHRSSISLNGVRRPAYEVDHLIPLELGGSPTDLGNLWPEPLADAKRKDKVENRLHALVCSGRLSLKAAQAAVARNWTRALETTVYRRAEDRSRRALPVRATRTMR